MYQRLVQNLAGPLAAGIGILSTAVVHQTISKSVALDVSTFILSSAATAAAHIKWLNNVPKWWEHERAVNPTLTSEASQIVKDVTPSVKEDVDRWYEEVLASQQKAAEVQKSPGTPVGQVTHGLNPNTEQVQHGLNPNTEEVQPASSSQPTQILKSPEG